MNALASVLAGAGHSVHNLDYPSRQQLLAELAENVAAQLRERGLADGGPDVGFVTHSMGAMVLRALPLSLSGFRCGRSVLLGPPFNGSVIAGHWGTHPLFRLLFGPALADLSPALVAQLPAVPGPYAVIAG